MIQPFNLLLFMQACIQALIDFCLPFTLTWAMLLVWKFFGSKTKQNKTKYNRLVSAF